MRVLVAIPIVLFLWKGLAWGQTEPAEGLSKTHLKMPGFVAACRPDRTGTGEAFSEGTLLVLVHDPRPLHVARQGQDLCESQTVLYFVTRDKKDRVSWTAMAWQHWSFGETPWEAEGGMMSAALAEDYYHTVIKQPFYFTENVKSYINTKHNFPVCHVKYEAMRYYIDEK